MSCTDFINISYGSIFESRSNNTNATTSASTPWRNQQSQQLKQDQAQARLMQGITRNYNLPPDPSIINFVFKDFKIDNEKEQQSVKLLHRNPGSKRIDNRQNVLPESKEFRQILASSNKTTVS